MPHTSAARNIDITLGNLHANAVCLLSFLMQQHILEMPMKDYNAFKEIYNKKVQRIDKHDIRLFDQTINRIKIKHPASIRLIGDILADQGSNDYFMLKLLEKLGKDKKIYYEILLSYHDAEFIHSAEMNFKEMYSNRAHRGEFISLENLGQLTAKKLVNIDTIKQIYDKYYLPRLKLLAYEFDQAKNKLYIFSHAPIGLDTIAAIAGKMDVPYTADSAESLMQTIDRINDAFNQTMMRRDISTLCGYGVDSIHTNPLVYLMLNRQYTPDSMPKMIEKGNVFKLHFVHGHHTITKKMAPRNVTNIGDLRYAEL